MTNHNYSKLSVAFGGVISSLVMFVLLASPMLVGATYYNEPENTVVDEMITVCHPTEDESNPYIKVTILASSVNSHDGHTSGEDVYLDVNGKCPGDDRGTLGSVNEAPVISLLGNSVHTITVNSVYADPGYTAHDYEDGDITSNVVVTGYVDPTMVGNYTLTYNVSDSVGLGAYPANRTVAVIPSGDTKGKISFCLVISDESGNIATSSNDLPNGVFSINLATTTSNIASTTIITKTWSSQSYTPNYRKILETNDSECVTYPDLDFGTYLYSELSVVGASWNPALYNDHNDQYVVSLGDFFPYGNTNTNSDGVVIIGEERPERVVIVYLTYKKGPSCQLPTMTSSLTAGAIANQLFIYNLLATSTGSLTYNVATTTLPQGLDFSTSTNSIFGTPTTVGTYNVKLMASNSCGLSETTLVLTVTGGEGNPTTGANLSVSKTANSTSVNAGSTVTYTISVANSGPESASGVAVSDMLPSNLEFVSASSTFGTYASTTGLWTIGSLSNGSTTVLTLVANVKSGTEGQRITNIATASSSTFDPNTGNNTSTSEVNINPLPTSGSGGGGGGSVVSIGSGGGGGNGPIVGSFGGGGGSFASAPITSSSGTSTSSLSCNYLNDHLRKDFDNNPVEVMKLQAFLRIFEGQSDLAINGIYDNATINAVNLFQSKYKDDILTPWGHTAPTGYTYILTKKKVNEIFCNRVFELSADQQSEITAYRNRSLSSQNSGGAGGSLENPEVGYGPRGQVGSAGVNPFESSDTGKEDNSMEFMTTLAGLTSTTKNMANAFTVSTTESTKRLSNFLFSLFGVPASWFGNDSNMCELEYSGARFLNFILLLLLALILYLWNRQSKRDRKIYDELNKEIDLNQ